MNLTLLRKHTKNLFSKFTNKSWITILAYHRICKFSGKFYDSNISAEPEEFQYQMEYIKSKYNIISVNELINFYYNDKNIPQKSIMITFDDAFKDTIKNAFPVLKKYNIPALLFCTQDFMHGNYVQIEDESAYILNNINFSDLTNKILSASNFQQDKYTKILANIFNNIILKKPTNKNDILTLFCREMRPFNAEEKNIILDYFYKYTGFNRNEVKNLIISENWNMMDENDVKTWLSSGMKVGGHTISHVQVSSISEEKLRKEINDSKSYLEKISGENVQIFAYPYGSIGSYNQTAIDVIKTAGYKCAMTMQAGKNNIKTNNFILKRIGIAPNIPFKKACEGIC